MGRLTNAAKTLAFGYDAVKRSPMRQHRKVTLVAEDSVLSGKQRKQAWSDARELRRNFAVAAWAIRTHCAQVAQHNFQCRTNDEGLNREVEALVEEWSQARNCDAAGRHPLDRKIWLAEMSRVVDGEVFFYDLGDGHWQAIEADRIAAPQDGKGPDLSKETHANGLIYDKQGKTTRLVVCKRSGEMREYEDTLDADKVLHHGFFDRFDQARGVSPLLAALSSFQDVAESAEYALAKAKMATYFGVKLKHGEGWEPPENPSPIKLGKGPQVFHLEYDEDTDFMVADQPGPAFREYLHSMLMMSLKALDLDFCLYDSSHTNYAGARQALLMWEQSSKPRKAEVRELRDEMTRRRLDLALKKRELKLPREATRLRWEWVAIGRGWIDPLKEVRSHAAAIAAGIKSRQQICRESGLDFRAIADQLGEEADYLNGKGLDTANSAQLAAMATALVEAPEEDK